MFGPEPPEEAQGESARPTDPDATGGYDAPLRVSLDATRSLAFARVRCGLAGVTREQSVEWTRRYRPNANPAVEAVERVDGDRVTALPTTGEQPSLTVARGAQVRLRVRWAAASAETYVMFDPVVRQLVERREGLRVSWYASDGRFADVRTGRSGTDAATDTASTWTAPGSAGEVFAWVVLRDDRGGVEWRALRVRVE